MYFPTAKLQEFFKAQQRDFLLVEPSKQVVEKLFISFNFLCITLLIIFSLLNALNNFYLAFWIDIGGIFLYLSALFLRRKSLGINKACAITVFTCGAILFFQSIILEPEAYHNMFFYPAIALFCFALFSDKKYAIGFFGFTCVTAISSYFIPKYLQTSVWELTAQEKDFYLISSVLASLMATYKAGAALYYQKQQAFEKLNLAHQELEQLNEKNKKLLQLIIHDISTPLNSIQFGLYRLKKKAHADQEVAQMNQLASPAISTIRDIIDTSRKMMALEEGSLVTEISPVDVVDCLRESANLFSCDMKEKNLRLEALLPERPSKILADPKSLKASVLNNILSNAIKFSHRDSVIKVRIEEKARELELVIEDEGIGIPCEQQEQIFQAENSRSRKGTEGEQGTGYGLPLAKAFMDSYGGGIKCESIEGKGTKISLLFRKVKQL